MKDQVIESVLQSVGQTRILWKSKRLNSKPRWFKQGKYSIMKMKYEHKKETRHYRAYCISFNNVVQQTKPGSKVGAFDYTTLLCVLNGIFCSQPETETERVRFKNIYLTSHGESKNILISGKKKLMKSFLSYSRVFHLLGFYSGNFAGRQWMVLPSYLVNNQGEYSFSPENLLYINNLKSILLGRNRK